jgi:hypothetical protein
MDEHVRELIEKEQRKRHSEQNEPLSYSGVLCDKHGVEMERVVVMQGRGIVTERHPGFRCRVPSCRRFFGELGYADITSETKFENILSGPACALSFPQSRCIFSGHLQASFVGYVLNAKRKDPPPSTLVA